MRDIKTIHMGLNTEPDSSEKAMELRKKIVETMNKFGECRLSWSCTGRTRHSMHAHQWRQAFPEYYFEIGDNYECYVTTRD